MKAVVDESGQPDEEHRGDRIRADEGEEEEADGGWGGDFAERKKRLLGYGVSGFQNLGTSQLRNPFRSDARNTKPRTIPAPPNTANDARQP